MKKGREIVIDALKASLEFAHTAILFSLTASTLSTGMLASAATSPAQRTCWREHLHEARFEGSSRRGRQTTPAVLEKVAQHATSVRIYPL